MIENQLDAMEARYEELSVASAQPDVIADIARYRDVIREMSDLEGTVMAWREAKKTDAQISEADDNPYFKDEAKTKACCELARNAVMAQAKEKLQLFDNFIVYGVKDTEGTE